MKAELATSEAHRAALLRALTPGGPRVTLREAFTRRGLCGDDEIAAAIRAWTDARRLPDLLDAVDVRDPEGFAAMLDERMMLVTSGDAVAAGVIGVHVGPDRSERHTAPPVRSALARMATGLLVRGVKRLVVHGGTPAWQRELKDGLDRRIDARFYPYLGRAPLPDVTVEATDVVVIWGGAVADPRLAQRHPNAILVPERGLVALCRAVSERT